MSRVPLQLASDAGDGFPRFVPIKYNVVPAEVLNALGCKPPARVTDRMTGFEYVMLTPGAVADELPSVTLNVV